MFLQIYQNLVTSTTFFANRHNQEAFGTVLKEVENLEDQKYVGRQILDVESLKLVAFCFIRWLDVKTTRNVSTFFSKKRIREIDILSNTNACFVGEVF